MYSSQFPATPYIDSYLREGRMTGEGETARDMVNRVVAELADADRRFDPDGTSFTLHLGEAMDTRRIVFSTPIMTNAGRYPSRPMAACAVPPVSLRGDLSQIKSVVDDYINLGRFHSPGRAVPVDLDDLAATVRLVVRALDDALETSLTRYPHVQSAMIMTAKRKIGVGICGLADLLLAAGLPYDSDAGRQLAMDIIAYVNYVSKQASADLATTRGACPAVLDGRSRYTDPAFLQRFAGISTRTVTAEDWTVLASQIASTGQLRNSSTIAIPPTGRSSPVIGASTGIEPLFRLTDPHLPGQLHPGAQSALRASGRADLLDFVLSYGRLPDDNVHAALRALLATATQIAPGGHLAMAAAVQGCTDEAVAKTVNLPQTANRCDIRDIYHTAWEAGCKGITVYREGSRTIQPKAL